MYDRTTRAFAALFLLVSLAPPGCKEKAPAAPEAKSVTPEIQGCIPRCEGRQCGDDGCRGSCGECPADHRCNDRSECEPIPCTPDCTDKACGDDGCGGSCGACVGHRICDESFRCVIPPCEPDCVNKQCGGDGCGGICGICNPGTICREFRCIEEPCTPDCANRVCGDDGCGGTCGSCPPPNGCKEGRCERRIAVGFLVGDGTESWRKEAPSLGDFSRRLGNPPAVAHTMIGFPADWSGKCEYSDFPKAWFDNWLGVNPVGNAMITLLPQCGFPDFVEGFEPGSAAYEATRKLAETIAKVPGPVFLRFAHDMNTHWYPWATCYFDNRRKGCARTAADYQKGFANFARVIHQFSEGKGQVVWCPHEWEPYWGEKYSNYPRYEAFYPGDEAVDWVGLDLYYQETKPPRIGTFGNRIRSFYDTFAAGHNKPMMIAETAVECRIDEGLECIRSLGDFNTTREWWGAWGELDTSRSRGAADQRCERLYPGHSHIVFAARPDTLAPQAKPHPAPNYYVGGTAFPLDWNKGYNFEKGNILVFSGRRDKEGTTPILQVELCDVEAPECPKDAPCCDQGTYSASIAVDSTDWKIYVLPLADFQPTVEASDARLDWRRIRVVKLHLSAQEKTDNLAPLHLDAMGLGRWKRRGGASCEKVVAGWAGQLFSPHQCYEWPQLKMILWYHDRKGSGYDVQDYRIQDYDLFRELLSDPCFQGSFF